MFLLNMNILLSFLLFVIFPETIGQSRKNKACEMLIVVDDTLYQSYGSDDDRIINLVDEHIDELNRIFHGTVFIDRYSQLYFHAKNIEIWSDFCEECNQTQTVFLNQFSKYDTSDYCLAVLFTHRDFPHGIQGLAWRNTVCQDSFNTAFITFINHNIKSSKGNSIMTLAHEVGHVFGARHDEDTDCKSPTTQFIMSSSGSSEDNLRFSSCSLEDMNKKLDSILRNSSQTCFVAREQEDYRSPGFCGNLLVEEGEECDCGLDLRRCADPCCYPGLLSPSDRETNASARPCHTHTSRQCLQPWHTPLIFGLVIPWTVILSLTILLCILLCLDWRRDKQLFLHLTEYQALRREEERDVRPRQRPTIIHSVTLRGDSDIPSQDHTKVRSQIMRFEASQQSSTPPRASVPESSARKPKLRPTSTKGYTVNPQRPAPPPPPPPKK